MAIEKIYSGIRERRDQRAEALLEAIDNLIEAKMNWERAQADDPEWACPAAYNVARSDLLEILKAELELKP